MPRQTRERSVDCLLRTRMGDWGWNCEHLHGAVHSSMHTTLSVLEGWVEYRAAGYTYRLAEIEAAQAAGEEFLLAHRLYRSHRTGQPMDPKMTMLPYPSRWCYDILRSLDYFRFAGQPDDPRMDDASKLLLKKRLGALIS